MKKNKFTNKHYGSFGQVSILQMLFKNKKNIHIIKKHKTCFYEKNKKTRNQYALPPEGNAIPAQAT